MRVKITQKDIDEGLVRSHTLDAFCRGLKRAILQHYKVRDVKMIFFNLDFGFINEKIVWLPDKARMFIQHSDTDKKLYPTEFDLELPEDLFK